jgi:hypothetical protein
VVLTSDTQFVAGHEGLTPITKPVAAETNVTEAGSKPWGTAVPTGGASGGETVVVVAEIRRVAVVDVAGVVLVDPSPWLVLALQEAATIATASSTTAALATPNVERDERGGR